MSLNINQSLVKYFFQLEAYYKDSTIYNNIDEPRNIMLPEIVWTQKDKYCYCMVSLMYEVKKE